MGVGGMPTAFKAVYGSGKPVIGFLAEYDALPELSQEGGCTMRKKAAGDNPDGHGCGHNLLGAGAMAAALAVKAYIEEHLEAGTVILLDARVRKRETERQSWHEKVYLPVWMLLLHGIRAIRMRSGLSLLWRMSACSSTLRV